MSSPEAIEIPALTNEGFFSDFYLQYRITKGLAPVLDQWRETTKHTGDPTPKTRLERLDGLHRDLSEDAAGTGPDPDDPTLIDDPTETARKAQHELNQALLTALGWHRGGDDDPDELHVLHRSDEVVVPVAHERRTASGRLLVALETVWTTDPSDVVTNPRTTDGERSVAGRLLDPLTRTNGTPAARTLYDAANLLFGLELDPPRYVLGLSGGAIVLLDRASWSEGRWLGADLADALARHDIRITGELALLAGLFSADSLDPGDNPTNLLDDMGEAAAKEAAGVSKELRGGMRRAVELLANAVVDDLRTRQRRNVLGNPDNLEQRLTRQTLRYLYRIIVLLYAEARPELEILPTDAPEYEEGYGLQRLRRMALATLQSPAALEARHIQQSLALLFDKVRHGHHPDDQQAMDDAGKYLEFAPLRSTLFNDDACPLLDGAYIPDRVMQQVLLNLCYTRPGNRGERQQVSYATLGVNQLGSVYEGLMSFKGFIATEDLFEVDRDGNPENGSWVIPVTDADDFPDDVFVTEEDEFGQPQRVRYGQFDFVYRLAGRDRERSASFYTPHVLTEFTVRHTLEELEEANPDLTADDWLEVTVCEPALGSGSFLNEAVTQLASRYLVARQEELDEQIPPEDYPLALQRAKAHFAVNQAYGVDLNASGVELAEVSLWLNCMHAGLTPPRLDARIRRGNSLIGSRRALYSVDELAKRPWKGTSKSPLIPPTDQHLAETPLGSASGIHHFLVPGEGWGAAADAVELRGKGGKKPVEGLAEDWASAIKDWRRDVQRKPSAAQVKRLEALGRRVEEAWAAAAADAAAFHRSTRQTIAGLYGAPEADPLRTAPEQARLRFFDRGSPAGRLRILMDAWCALWMWGPEHGSDLPTMDEWIDAGELLLGKPDAVETGQLFDAAELDGQGSLASLEQFGKAGIDEVVDQYPWLQTVQGIADKQAYFHWELEHAPVLGSGGFDLQVGNPPWVRLDWQEEDSLAEHDPWWGVTDLKRAPAATKQQRRGDLLAQSVPAQDYVRDRTETSGLAAVLGAETREPNLVGIRTNLYMVFMTTSWRHVAPSGMIGLIHPESHFVDPKAGTLRSQTYARLRRHWQFPSERTLFDDVQSRDGVGVHVYGRADSPNFLQAVNLYDPGTLDRSLAHDGEGEKPGIQHPEGGWDLRPHASRIVKVNSESLENWVRLFDPPGTPADQSRLLLPLTTADLSALRVFANQPRRLADTERKWTSGFNEKNQKDDGTLEWRTEVSDTLEEVILQGPHILNTTPFAQQPNEGCTGKDDWSPVNLALMPPEFVPRTNYQRSVSYDEFRRRQPTWGGEPFTTRFREIHREYVSVGSVRTMQACLIPPGPSHVHAVVSMALDSDVATVRWSGLLSSLPVDFAIRMGGKSHMSVDVLDSLPWPHYHQELDDSLALRTLRLACVSAAYADLWSASFRLRWKNDSFTIPTATPLEYVQRDWSPATCLRADIDRWMATVETDAIVALLLGLTEGQLLQMYRSQFAVLRKYEHQMAFDAHGRQVCGDYHAYGHLQAELETAAKENRTKGWIRIWDRVEAWMGGEESVDLGPFKPPFTRADRETAMSRAYQTFVERFDLTPGVPAGEQVNS